MLRFLRGLLPHHYGAGLTIFTSRGMLDVNSMAVEQQPAYESFGQFRARITRELDFAQKELLVLASIVDTQTPAGISIERKFLGPNPLTACANQIRVSFYPDHFQITALPTSVKDVLPDIVGESEDLEVILALDDPDSLDYGGDDYFSFALILKSRIPRPDKVALGISSLEGRRPFFVTVEAENFSDEQRILMEKYRGLGLTVQGETQFRAILVEGARWAEKIIRGRIYPQMVNLESYRQNRSIPPSSDKLTGRLYSLAEYRGLLGHG